MRKLSALLFVVAIAMALLPSRASAHPSVSVVMDARGNVFYSDLSRVWMIAPNGQRSIAVPNVHSHELTLDADGNLYGEHLWYEGKTKKWGHRVWKRAPDGSITDVIPAADGFLANYSFVRDSTGTMYWAARGKRTEIRKRSGNGPITVVARGPFRDVRWMTASRGGTLYLIDSGDLKRIPPNGKVEILSTRIASRSMLRMNVSEQHAVMGLWLDNSNNLYAAVYGSGEVKRITPSGEVSVVATSSLPWGPTGGMVAPNGDLYILEASITNSVRLKKISRNGGTRIY